MTTANAAAPTLVSRAATALGLLALGLFLYLVRDTLPPFLIGFAAASLLDPVLDRMQRRGWSRRAAAVVVFGLFLILFAGVALVLIPAAVQQAAEFVANAPGYYGELARRLQEAMGARHDLLTRLGLPTTTSQMLARYQPQLTGFLQTLVQRLLQFFAGSAAKLVWVAIIPIVTFYALLEIDAMRARIVHLVPHRHRPRLLDLSERIGAVFSGYARGLILVCAANGVVIGVVLALGFRLSYALMIGLVAGVLYAVPYVGAISTVAIAGLVAVATHHSTGYIVGVLLTLLAINQLFDQLITPRVVGEQVGLHPVVSLFALTAGGALFGLAGMILAVPVAASLKVVMLSLWPQLAEPLPDADGRQRDTRKTTYRAGRKRR